MSFSISQQSQDKMIKSEKNYKLLSDAAIDPEIANQLDLFYSEINFSICKEFDISLNEQIQFAENSRKNLKIKT